MHNLEGMAVFINITDEVYDRPYSTIPGRDSKIQGIEGRLKTSETFGPFLNLFKDGLPACSTAEQVSQKPWEIIPFKTDTQTTGNSTISPVIQPNDCNGTSATKFSIIFSFICVLFNLI